jgi:WS/DGAT/MGAT family acyltransferase
MDAQFLYAEEEIPAAHTHTLKVSIYEPGPEPYAFETSKAILRDRLDRLPPFRWRLVPVPLDLHHPVWIEDPEFDLDWHVRRMAAPAPGGPRELCELISEIASRQLDRSRPLWELWLIEGLEGGQVAAVAKVHHALADGVSSAALLDLFHDTVPDAEVAPPEQPWRPEPVPSKLTLVLHALRDVLRVLFTGLPELLRAARAAREKKTIAGLAESEMPPKAFKAPTLAFNRVITPHRIFTIASASLDDVRQVRNAFDCTVNDVFLATVAGGMRRYLTSRDELPDAPLVASVPASTRADAEKYTWGNRLSKLYVRLRTDVEDPVERLMAQRGSAQAMKQEFEITRGARLENWIEVMPVPMLRWIGRTFDRVKRLGGPSSENLILSNVPGPRQPLFAGGAKLSAFYSIGPIAVGVGLNITVWSYVNQLNYCMIACREAMPDLWDLTDHIRDELGVLMKAAANQQEGGA